MLERAAPSVGPCGLGRRSVPAGWWAVLDLEVVHDSREFKYPAYCGGSVDNAHRVAGVGLVVLESDECVDARGVAERDLGKVEDDRVVLAWWFVEHHVDELVGEGHVDLAGHGDAESVTAGCDVEGQLRPLVALHGPQATARG